MKIELPNGITIHLEDGENIDAVLPLLRPGDPTPRLTAEEEAVDPGQTIPLFVKNDGLTAAPAPLVSDALKTRMPRTTATLVRRIGTVYVTRAGHDIVELLRRNPDGLSTREMVLATADPAPSEKAMAKMVSNLSGHVSKLVKETGLAYKVRGSLVFKLTDLGSEAKMEIDAKPWLRNKENKLLMRYLREVTAE